MDLTVDSSNYPLIPYNDAVNRYKSDTSISVVCKSEGSLPLEDIEFKVECQNRNPALTEQYRLERARQLMPVEIFYGRYGFAHPPNEAELSNFIAMIDAKELKTDAAVVQGPTVTRATVKLKSRADNCELICSQVGVETRKIIHVEYENSVVYILPRPDRDYLRAGQVLNCYADGNPPSSISMYCISPQNSPLLLGHLANEIIRDNAFPPSFNRKGALIFSYDRKEDILFYDSDDEKSVRQIVSRLQSLRQQEIVKYVTEDRRNSCGSSGIRIAGSQLIISDNATVGTEVFVACYSDNAQNYMRFIINRNPHRLNASLAVVLGICCGLLLLSMIIIGIMIMTKRRQLQQQSAFDARNHAGYLAEEKRLKSKMASKNYYGDPHTQGGGLNKYSPARQGPYKYDQDGDEAIMRPGRPGMAASVTGQISSFNSNNGSLNHFKLVDQAAADFREQRRTTTPEIQPLLDEQQQQRDMSGTATPEQAKVVGSLQSLPRGSQAFPRTISMGSSVHTASPARGHVLDDLDSRRFSTQTPQQQSPAHSQLFGTLSPKESVQQLAEQQRREATDALFGMMPRSNPARV